MQTLREKIQEETNASKPLSDDELVEVLIYEDSIEECGHDERRWYTLYDKVVKVGEIYVCFEYYSNHGDEPAFDNEERMDMVLESMVEVFPKEVTVTSYVTADQL